MYDPKFEKEVQKKMEELEFSPSEAVWTRLEREIGQEKRRRAPLFWLLFFSVGILLGAGGSYLVFSHRSASRVAIQGGSPLAAPRESPVAVQGESRVAVPGESRVAAPPVEKVSSGYSGTAGTPRHKEGTDGRLSDRMFGNGMAVNGKVAAGAVAVATPTTGGDNMAASGKMTVADLKAPGDGPAETGQPGQGSVINEPDIPRSVVVTAERAAVDTAFCGDIASRVDLIRPAPGIPGAHDLYSPGNKAEAGTARLARSPQWKAGFAGGGGMSSVLVSGLPMNLAVLAPGSPSSTNSNGPAQDQVSKVQPDLSFWAGIFVQKPISRKLSLTAGLNLHYYSTRLQTGQKIPDSIASAAALSGSSSYIPSSVQSYPFYAPGNSYQYTNRYYFLELPVSLQWQLNRGRKTPLFWEGGLALSRLMSADALYYNEKSGVYDKDGAVANPTHLMAFTSLMIGLSWRGNLIQWGPQGQYGFGSLLNTQNAGGQHLFYGGLKVMVIPRKW